MAPSMAPGPGAANANPTQAPGVAPLPPLPTTSETATPPVETAGTTPTAGAAAAPQAATTLESAKPDQPRKFGDKGVFVVTDTLGANFGVLGYSESSVGSAGFSLNPAVDYFIDENLIVGASAYVRYSSSTTAPPTKTHGWAEGAFVHLGRNVPLSDLLSVRPLGALGLWHSDTTTEGILSPFGYLTSSSLSETAIVLDLYVPLLFHPARHFFVGFGPDAFFDPYHSFSSGGSTSDHLRYFVGASSIIGGWI